MKLNNKGFAVTGILYTLLVLFLALMLGLISVFSNRKNILNKLKEGIVDNTLIYILDIVLDTNVISVLEGNSTIINVTILPDNATNKNLIWKSLDEEIAVVENGIITGIKNGTTTIEVRTSDGSEIIKTIEVSVKEDCKEDWCIWLDKGGIDKSNYTGISQIVNDADAMQKLTSNNEATTYMVNSSNIMNEVVESSIARRAMFNNYNITEPLLANSSIAIEAMQKSSNYKSKTMSCSWNRETCDERAYLDAFMLKFVVNQSGDYRNTLGAIYTLNSSQILCQGGQTCTPNAFTNHLRVVGQYYMNPSGTSTTTFYYFEI